MPHAYCIVKRYSETFKNLVYAWDLIKYDQNYISTNHGSPILNFFIDSKCLGCLTLAFFICVAVGCAKQAPDPAQLRADETTLVQSTVTDAARAERLLALLEERDRLIEETRALFQQYRREMKALNADYDASRDLLIEMIDYYNRERARKQLAFIDLVSKMKAATSAEEWAVIADFQLKNFNPRRLIFQRLPGAA